MSTVNSSIIDLQYTFKSTSWESIARTLHSMGVPQYLCSILGSYFLNRTLVYEKHEDFEHNSGCSSRINSGPDSVESDGRYDDEEIQRTACQEE